MSFANGIGSLQQVLSSITPATTAAKTQATEPAGASNHSEASVANAAHAQRTDQASLSSASELMAHALEGSDVRSEKVAALQQAIASGSYHVSSSDVADKMIHSLTE